MEKITKQDPKSQSADIVSDNIEKLLELFPEIRTESNEKTGIDFEVLHELLGDYIEGKEERYNFTWHGKSRARRLAQLPSTGTLRPCKNESVEWDKSKNILIEGDNLEVLKLLQKNYHKKVKMIYIDPPYNTGKEFIYPDKYQDNLDTYLRYTGQIDDEGFKVSANTETTGRYHTNWLNMMYPRLKLARNLLKDDGVIFISIDDTEVKNLRFICDEIFGEDNFLAQIAWEKRYTRSNNAKRFYSLKDNILAYRKSDLLEYVKEARNEKSDSNYSNPDNDPRGPWTTSSYVNPATKSERPNLVYEISNPFTNEPVSHPTHAWKHSHNENIRHAAENRLWWGKDGNAQYPRLKIFLSEQQKGLVPIDVWDYKSSGTTDEGGAEIKELFGSAIFDTPKPTKLIKKMLGIATSKENEDIILDFFSGSGSTGHAVMLQNTEDSGNRRFILVQLPEPCPSESLPAKSGFNNISDITKERIRRAATKIAKESTQSNCDLGFKTFKLDATNINSWDAEFETLEDELALSIDSIKADRNSEDILYEVLLKYGLDLTLPIEEHQISGKTVYNVGMGALIVCLDDTITIEAVEGIGKLKEELKPEVMRVVFKDSGFADDVVKTNAVQVLKQFGIDDVRSI